MKTAPSAVTSSVTGLAWLGSAAAADFGRSMGTPVVIIGAATMKMMSSTSITSTIGVMLISLITAFLRLRRRRPPPPPPEATPIPMSVAPRFELAAENGGEFVGKAFQPADQLAGIGAELVIGDNRRNGGDKADSGSEQRFGNRARHDGEAGVGRGGNGGKGIHDAPDRAEQPDERTGRTDG